MTIIQILIDEKKSAYGVAYKRHGIPQIAHARREVILSCDTLSSPMLLIRSGIGPKARLEKAEVISNEKQWGYSLRVQMIRYELA